MPFLQCDYMVEMGRNLTQQSWWLEKVSKLLCQARKVTCIHSCSGDCAASPEQLLAESLLWC